MNCYKAATASSSLYKKTTANGCLPSKEMKRKIRVAVVHAQQYKEKDNSKGKKYFALSAYNF